MSELIVKKLSVSNKLPLKSFNAGSEYVLIPGPQGEPGPEGASAYDVAVANGFKGSETEWLATLKGEKGADGKIGADGAPGKSVYDIWLEQGNIGTEEDFLNSLKGEKGADGTMFFEDLTEEQKESLKGEPGATGPIGPEGPQGPQGEKGADGTMIFEDLTDEQKESLKGADGKSAYQIWIDAGNEGTEQDFLNSLVGESGENGEQGEAGQNGLSAYEIWLAEGNSGTEQDFLNSLKGEKGADGTMTFEDLTDEQKESLKGDPGEKGESGEPGANGKSAYDIWLDAGNTGSEEEFLKALKGEKGDEGQPGQDGNKGDDGFSPIVTVTETDNGHNVAIEDVNGVQNFEVLDGKGIITSLEELGLTAPVTVGDIFNAMPDNTIAMIACEDITDHITDVPTSYGILTIKRKNNSRFSIEYQNSLGGSATNVRRWIGTLKGTDGSSLYWKEIQTEIGVVITSDIITKYGTEILKYPVGTWRIDSVNIGKQFTDLPYTEMAGVIEIDSIQPNRSPYEHSYGYRNYTFKDALTNVAYTRSLNSGNTVGTIQRDSGWRTTGSHFYSLSQMYLSSSATIQDVINALPIGSTAILRTDEFTNWSTLFNGIQWGYFKVEKTVNSLSNIELQEVVTPNRRYFGTQSSGKFDKWQQVQTGMTYTSLSELGLTADATFQDVIDKLPKGGSALLGVTEFTNYQTIFPYKEGNDQFARVYIVKGSADGSRMYARWFRKDGVKEAIAKFNINTNKFDGWQMSANKQEIIDEVLAAIPSSEGVEY